MTSKEEQENIQTYNQISDQWASVHNTQDFWSKEYQKFKELLPGGKIIDLGCGFGRDSVFFNKNGYEYLGIDAAEKMVVLAKKHNPGLNFELKDLNNLDYPPETFDGFWASCSLLHISKQNIKSVLESIYRILKPGGVGFIAIKEGLGEEMENWQNSELRRFFSYYEKTEFENILESVNFSIIDFWIHDSHFKKSNFLVFFVKK